MPKENSNWGIGKLGFTSHTNQPWPNLEISLEFHRLLEIKTLKHLRLDWDKCLLNCFLNSYLVLGKSGNWKSFINVQFYSNWDHKLEDKWRSSLHFHWFVTWTGLMSTKTACYKDMRLQVNTSYCNLRSRPATGLVPCNTQPCPARWDLQCIQNVKTNLANTCLDSWIRAR